MNDAARPPLDFYFDFISPFGYFAALRIDAIAARHGRRAEWHAMLLGVSVMKVMGLKPVLETPLKGPYLTREAARYARRHGIETKRPFDGPAMNPLPAARAFHWVRRHHPERHRAVGAALLDAYWRQGVDLEAPDTIAAIAAEHGADRSGCRAACESAEGRALLRAAVAASLARGVFGSPYVIADDEPFWGVAALETLDAWLATGGW